MVQNLPTGKRLSDFGVVAKGSKDDIEVVVSSAFAMSCIEYAKRTGQQSRTVLEHVTAVIGHLPPELVGNIVPYAIRFNGEVEFFANAATMAEFQRQGIRKLVVAWDTPETMAAKLLLLL